MTKLVLTGCLFSLILIAFSQQGVPEFKNRLYEFEQGISLMRQAEALEQQVDVNPSVLAHQTRIYLGSLNFFRKAESGAASADSLDFHCLAQQALVYHLLDSTTAARRYYEKAIVTGNTLASLEDSFLFAPYLFLGGIYHSASMFDSAIYCYRQSDNIQLKYGNPLQGAERLYNRLGVIQYETGNYNQARNYFEKAITMLATMDPGNASLHANYLINIGSMHIKLEEYEQAEEIFTALLRDNVFRNEALHNLGIAYQRQGKYLEALSTFRKIRYINNHRSVDLFYNLGVAFHSLNQPDSSAHYLDLAFRENRRWNGDNKNLTLGLIHQFQGDRLATASRYAEAASQYQLGIIQLHPTFNEQNPSKNPSVFTGVSSYLTLFNLLISKAQALEKMNGGKSKNHLASALEAYTSAFNLASYVEQVYDSDESRFFLNKIKHSVHSQPIRLSLRLHELSHDKKYLNQAYLFDQQNKGSILSLNILNNEIGNKPGPFNQMIERERSLKRKITRLSLKHSRLSDGKQKKEIHDEIREIEIKLGRLHDSLRLHPAHKDMATEPIPPVKKLQRQLDKSTAIISYHLSSEDLLALIITHNDFQYKVIPIDTTFFQRVEDMKNELSLMEYTVQPQHELYKLIFQPLEAWLPESGRLIVIPDDELHYLPFESFIDGSGMYLLNRYSFQYQYSTALLEKKHHYHSDRTTLAFAPFAGNSANNSYVPLPYSKKEVEGLQGNILIGEDATKSKFLQLAGTHRYLHLATHAKVNNDSPSRSYISFYPSGDDFLLYTDEIATLNLDSTELVILSACETGTGQLVKGEGLLSLSRAFEYAGCHDIITSLWKAEDRTTAYILEKMHNYLAEGLQKDKALQKAKLDLLADENIPPNLKSPSHWAHLIFIGQYEPQKKGIDSWMIVALLAVLIPASFIVIRKIYT